MSDLTYKELMDSDDPVKRLEYVKRIHQDIALNENVITIAISNRLPVDELKRLNMEMKERLTAFDVYRQKPMYSCWRCKEVECVCELL